MPTLHENLLSTPNQGSSRSGDTENTHPQVEGGVMHYHVAMIFHKDADGRPCRPLLHILNFETAPETMRDKILQNYEGVESKPVCTLQTCSAAVHDPRNIYRVYAVRVSDSEARRFMNNIAASNILTSRKGFTVVERTNLSLAPRWLHNSMQVGTRNMKHLSQVSTVTDTQLAMIVLRESLDPCRALYAAFWDLHPYLSTPENLFDTFITGSRRVETLRWKAGKFVFHVS